MNSVLVTGASSFLGYHVAKRLNASGLRPRVLELPQARLDALDRLEVERCSGSLDDPAAIRAACKGVDTLVHLAFKVSVGGGPALLEEMRRVNIEGTRRLLEIAAESGVQRAAVAGSALSVGVNRQPAALDESADWSSHAFPLPYAETRRKAELDARARSTPGFAVVSVCPAFTFGPDDPTGAPANKLLQALIARKLRFTLPVGFGCLDVRDFATGAILAAERGQPGRRYLLSGENVTTSQLLEQAAAIAGVKAPTFTPPTFLVRAAVAALEAVSRVRGKPAPVTRDVLQIIGRFAWYDTSRARADLGWTPRPLRETLEDTIQWLRLPESQRAQRGQEQGAAAP
jgi:dihydroflavonol-4-reductase